MQARVPGQRLEHKLAFGEKRHFVTASSNFDITLTPAGHIFGSAMSLLEAEGQSLLYTGDFKLKTGLSAEACKPLPADILVMETTYGRPQYVFPPSAAVLQAVIRFCREALDNEETPVLLGYSLGKSQEILCGLGQAGLPLMLHGSVFRLTQIYEQFGQCFPKYELYDSKNARGKVLLCPPNVSNSAMLRNLGKTRSAILTGWAVDPNCRYRYQCDAAFALSDHADYPDLIELVKQVQPKQVYTLHGFAADFAETLRDLGFQATALSEDEQLVLGIGGAGGKPMNIPFQITISKTEPKLEYPAETHSALPRDDSTRHPFMAFAEACGRISSDRSKLEKVRHVAEYLRTLTAESAALAATWFSGRPFPASQNKVLQLGWAVLRDALCAVGNLNPASLHHIYLKHSDVGETAEEVLRQHEAQPTLSVEEVNRLFHEIHTARGPLAKGPVLLKALKRCAPLEGKYLLKIITGDLRNGLKEGLVEEAVARAFEKEPSEVRRANLLLGDIGETARMAATNRLSEAGLIPFRPIKFMLASPEETSADIWERVREWQTDPNEPARVWLEDKYDGIRCQLHKVGQRVALFSRDLKEITSTFLELTDSLRKTEKDFILDGEIVAMRDDKVLPFAELQKRLGRREGDLFMREEVPIQYIAFDLLWLNGTTFLNQPLRERRAELEKLCNECLRFTCLTQAGTVEEIEKAFDAARARNNEGLMIKDPASIYAPGRRGLAWLKLKKALATLDCVVVGAEYQAMANETKF